MLSSPVPISVSETIISSKKKSPHPITPILDFKTGSIFLEKEKENTPVKQIVAV